MRRISIEEKLKIRELKKIKYFNLNIVFIIVF